MFAYHSHILLWALKVILVTYPHTEREIGKGIKLNSSQGKPL
ncbi:MULTISPECIES: hypothetical protein [Shewanella]|uniref:Transposase n=1 Tax=Shewanella scandinavica TaxID=3063538 RepID=A0ABU3G4Z8_9GAMM|nr:MULTISPECIES: hypothetical protein [Shewanella]MDT3281592.1 hypothetical protein [Shewanella sp. SP2S1-2]